MNIKSTTISYKKIAHLLRTLGQPARLKILLAIGAGEACVCHLESVLGMRQAYISQHLMALRKANLVEDRRDGRYIFYKLVDAKMLELIRRAADLSGYPEDELGSHLPSKTDHDCPCPHCQYDFIPMENIT